MNPKPLAIDAHQHFWRYSVAEYPWIGPGMERIARDFTVANLASVAEAAGVGGSVAVQARQSLDESRWLLAIADADPFVRGVVGWVDLRSETVSEDLARLSAHPRFVGVRHVVQDEPDDRFLLGESFVRGVGLLHQFGLVYDLLIYPRQLPAAVELASRLPAQPFVLDHVAKPAIRSGLLDGWRDDILRLARNTNVSCKVSGMVTEAAWQGWERKDFLPYLEVVLDAFGPERLMFGSDWPVCLLAAEYADVAGIVRDFTDALTADEREAIWGGTARRWYGLDP